MATWIIDVLEKSGRKNIEGMKRPDVKDLRHRLITAETFGEAFDRAKREVTALNKLASIRSGQEDIMSDRELDWLIEQDLYPLDMVSIPNPMRCGILDAYLVGRKSSPSIQAYSERVLSTHM